MQYQYTASCVSQIGLLRDNNEDNFLFDGKILSGEMQKTEQGLIAEGNTKETQIFAVFDGMGGELGGEIAAQTAAESLKADEKALSGEVLTPRAFLTNAVQKMSDAVFQKGEALGIARIGTTAAILHVLQDRFYICNVGDSRIYRYSGGELELLSEDDVIYDPKLKNQHLTQYVGVDPEQYSLQMHVKKGKISHNDLYLLCTDGLYNDVSEAELCKALREFRNDLAACAERLADMAEKNGGNDNCTTLLIQFRRKPWWKRSIESKGKRCIGNAPHKS